MIQKKTANRWALLGLALLAPAVMTVSGCNGGSGGPLSESTTEFAYAGLSASGPVTDSNNNAVGTLNFTVDQNGTIDATFNVLRALTVAPREPITGTGQAQSNGNFQITVTVPSNPDIVFTFTGTLPQQNGAFTANYTASNGTNGNAALTAKFSSSGGSEGSCGPGGANDAPAAAIPASMQGTYTLTFHESAPGSQITNGTQTQFIITADTLQFNGKTLTGPVSRNGNQFEWIFCDGNLEYAASINTNNGSLNEINVGGSGGSPFYGQFNDRNN